MSAFAPNMAYPLASPLHTSKSNTSDARRSSAATSSSSRSSSSKDEKRTTNPIKAAGKWIKEKVKGDESTSKSVGEDDKVTDDRSRQQEQKSMLKVFSFGSDVFDATMARSPYPGVGF